MLGIDCPPLECVRMERVFPSRRMAVTLCFLAFLFALAPYCSSAELDATWLLINQARAAARAGRYEEARKTLWDSITFADAAGQKLEMAIALNNMGEVYRLQGDTAEALHYYRRAVKIYEEIGHQDGIGITQRQIEEIQEAPDSTKKATLGKAGELQEVTSASLRERLIDQAIERVRKRLEAKRKGEIDSAE